MSNKEEQNVTVFIKGCAEKLFRRKKLGLNDWIYNFNDLKTQKSHNFIM